MARVTKKIQNAILSESMWDDIDVHGQRWDIIREPRETYVTFSLYCNFEWQSSCGDMGALKTIALWEGTVCKCED